MAFNASLKFGGILSLFLSFQYQNRQFILGRDAAIGQWLTQAVEKLATIQKPGEMPVSSPAQEAKPAAIMKHNWYQTESQVCVIVLAKNLNPAAVKVKFTPSTVSLFLHTHPFYPFK